ncbi:MAG: L,D-transpeptidase family protein [Anaerolineae bacterium]
MKHSIEVSQVIENARQALRRGEAAQARQWASQAVKLDPHSEDAWLILAAVSSPRASLEYLRKALQINPNSARARQGIEWAQRRLQETPEAENRLRNGDQPSRPWRGGAAPKRNLYPFLLITLGCLVLAVAGVSALSFPAMASVLNLGQVPPPTAAHSQVWAQAEIAKPTYTLTPSLLPPAATVTVTATATFVPVQLPADTPTPQPAFTLEATATPGTLLMEIVPDTPTPETVAAHEMAPEAPPLSMPQGVRWIDVNLSQQRVYAYEGDTLVNSFVVSTGTWQTPTVTGQFHIWIKLRSTTMTGPGYYLPNVPYTMYFYKGYGLHGTYWHSNFGMPMSHGCVNLSIPDAEWLYNWASVGTLVNVHY